ncbi:6-carboxytetrahydropterin synthase QueD [Clostridium sediminicola]|uniref:6-carboxytetrahydropterin synthase QueD n=1 Tax=Clostridium sediminicola TaxID=3114879 RepID=UPI0031F2116D
MYILRCEHSFDSAHFLSGYKGKCANIHGHRWRILAEVCSEKLIESGQLRGMVVDFGDLKKDLKEIVDYLDHALIIEKGTMREATLNCLKDDCFRIIEVDFRPTAESFGKYFYNKLKNYDYNIRRITVFETPSNCAVYEEV